MHHHTVFEITKNFPPQRCGRLGSALASLGALLSPMRALSASALVAAAMLGPGGQSAQGQETQTRASGEVISADSFASASLGMPDLDTPWLPPDAHSMSHLAQAATRSASAAWEGVYFAHKKDLTLDGGGPNGPNTIEWRYTLVLRAGGVSQFTAQIFYSYWKPGFGSQNRLRYFYDVWGPNQTATWSDLGGHFSITGAVAEGLQDSGNPALNYQRSLPRQTVSFTPVRWVGSNYQALQLTGVARKVFMGWKATSCTTVSIIQIWCTICLWCGLTDGRNYYL